MYVLNYQKMISNLTTHICPFFENLENLRFLTNMYIPK